MKPTTELLHQLKSAAQEEIMCREASDTSDAWQDLASPENILARIEIALPVMEQKEPAEWTNEQCLEFLSIAFRHAEISGDIEMDDIRLAVKMVNTAPKAERQPSTTPQIDNDGWIEWSGGDCPVIPGNRVDLKLRGGVITNDFPAEAAEWGHHKYNNNCDILAYRVIENDGGKT